MSHAATQHVLRDVSKYYVTFYCAKDQFNLGRSCEANLLSRSVLCFCLHVNQKATQFFMNTEFHATVRAVIITETTDTQPIPATYGSNTRLDSPASQLMKLCGLVTRLGN